MRSGRMRKALRTSSRIVTAPTPSALGGSGLEADHVRAGQAQFGRIFDGHDAFLARQDGREAVQQRGLAAARAAAHEDVRRLDATAAAANRATSGEHEDVERDGRVRRSGGS